MFQIKNITHNTKQPNTVHALCRLTHCSPCIGKALLSEEGRSMWSNVEVCSQMGASLAGAGSQKSSAVAYSCQLKGVSPWFRIL